MQIITINTTTAKSQKNIIIYYENKINDANVFHKINHCPKIKGH